MSRLLYLVHRLPYPPNKGDKVRSHHLLKHLAKRHEVHLGTFIDDPDDARHVDALRPLCADLHVATLSPRWARLRSLRGLLSEEALTLPYYRDAGLQTWVDRTCREHRIDAAVIFSSAMAQYLQPHPQLPTLVDFVDVDSAKWTQYAENHHWPMSWLYRREGERLLAFEKSTALGARRSFFVTDNEADLFRKAAPECSDGIEAMCNGVDADFFAPDPATPSPFPPEACPIVFTGAMDYWPNIDAVVWFAAEVFPRLRAERPQVRFYIVGRSPTTAVLALASDEIVVTGTVADVRPYLQHAAVVVAPLRVARGIQNKILEAMAMGRPVIASTACAGGIDAAIGSEFLSAADADETLRRIGQLLDAPERADAMGRAARQRVVERYSWDAHLSGIDRHLAQATAQS